MAVDVVREQLDSIAEKLSEMCAELKPDPNAIGAILLKWRRETCICATIRLPDGRIIRGHRHGDCIRTAVELIDHRHSIGLEPVPYEGMRDDMRQDSQGFITSTGRYVDRLEGMRLQRAAGIESAADGGYRGDILFSEDLY